MLNSEVNIPAKGHFSLVEITRYKELLSAFCSQLVRLGDPNVDRVAAKWLRESVDLDTSPASRRRIVAQASRIAKTAYALTALGRERSLAQLTQMQTDQLSATLSDLLAETDRIVSESMRIDEILDDRGLEMIVGETLSSVEFVMDYLQFRFGGPTLTAYNFPAFRDGASVLHETDSGYRDALCGLIGRSVERVCIRESKSLEIMFEGAATIEISLRPEDHKFPEVAEFWSPTGRYWAW